MRWLLVWRPQCQLCFCWNAHQPIRCHGHQHRYLCKPIVSFLSFSLYWTSFAEELHHLSEWSITVGNGCNYSRFPLWWANYNGKDLWQKICGGFVTSFSQKKGDPGFGGFSPFAGWSAPAIHQFADSAGNSCGVSIDRNWYP